MATALPLALRDISVVSEDIHVFATTPDHLDRIRRMADLCRRTFGRSALAWAQQTETNPAAMTHAGPGVPWTRVIEEIARLDRERPLKLCGWHALLAGDIPDSCRRVLIEDGVWLVMDATNVVPVTDAATEADSSDPAHEEVA